MEVRICLEKPSNEGLPSNTMLRMLKQFLLLEVLMVGILKQTQ